MASTDSLTLPQRIVLLSVATLERDEETPATVNVITVRAQEHAAGLAEIGKLTEAEVDRALNVLDAEGLVSMPATDEKSPVGKGRPAYEMAVDVETPLEALSDDEDVGSLIEQ